MLGRCEVAVEFAAGSTTLSADPVSEGLPKYKMSAEIILYPSVVQGMSGNTSKVGPGDARCRSGCGLVKVRDACR